MSVDSFFFVRDDKLPDIAKWQAALDRANSGIVLEDVGDLCEHTGYLPMTHRGHASGFEWYYGPIAGYFDDDERPDGLGDRAHVVNCVTHSDLREFVCGLIACSVVAQMADGLYFDEDCGEAVSVSVALEMARGLESKLR